MPPTIAGCYPHQGPPIPRALYTRSTIPTNAEGVGAGSIFDPWVTNFGTMHVINQRLKRLSNRPFLSKQVQYKKPGCLPIKCGPSVCGENRESCRQKPLLRLRLNGYVVNIWHRRLEHDPHVNKVCGQRYLPCSQECRLRRHRLPHGQPFPPLRIVQTCCKSSQVHLQSSNRPRAPCRQALGYATSNESTRHKLRPGPR